MITDKLRITLSSTSDGLRQYLQILSEDTTVNIVLIAAEFELRDVRPKPDAKPKKKA